MNATVLSRWGFAAVIALSSESAVAVEIRACLTLGGELKRVTVDALSSCGANEQLLSWSVAGPKGDKGDKGDPGEPGADGAPAPREEIAGLSSVARGGSSIGDFSREDCIAAFGPGARWADTKDLATLPLSQGYAGSGFGWVNIHVVQAESNSQTNNQGIFYVDYSGFNGRLDQIACGGVPVIPNDIGAFMPWSPHSSISVFEGFGFIADPTVMGRPSLASCRSENNVFPAVCVGPVPAL